MGIWFLKDFFAGADLYIICFSQLPSGLHRRVHGLKVPVAHLYSARSMMRTGVELHSHEQMASHPLGIAIGSTCVWRHQKQIRPTEARPFSIIAHVNIVCKKCYAFVSMPRNDRSTHLQPPSHFLKAFFSSMGFHLDGKHCFFVDPFRAGYEQHVESAHTCGQNGHRQNAVKFCWMTMQQNNLFSHTDIYGNCLQQSLMTKWKWYTTKYIRHQSLCFVIN